MTERTATEQLSAATEPFRRSDLALQRFARFRTLWAQYRSALAQPFGKDRSEDEAIRAKVDAAFDALNDLAREL